MGKPSIFSKDYEKGMRKRKQKIKLAVFISIVVIIFGVVSAKGIFKNIGKDTSAQLAKIGKIKTAVFKGSSKDISKTKSTSDPSKNTSQNTDAKKTAADLQKNAKDSEAYTVQLSDGKNISAVYDIQNNNKVFKYISPTESNIVYSISPSGNKMVIFDDKAQSIILLDTNGNKQDITDPQYIASDGTVITKNATLSQQSNYIWCSYPRFIDDNNIAYISNLPWIGKTTKYIWVENINNKTYSFVQGVQGDSLTLGKLTDKGLTVVEDGNTVFLTADGNVQQ